MNECLTAQTRIINQRSTNEKNGDFDANIRQLSGRFNALKHFITLFAYYYYYIDCVPIT
jgi:hypothetical protein